ncbi:O-antigen ligase family protein [Caldisericum exile]|uniref:O-antigen polymerase family protein n=1 Tax=Caldisericum exile (strain DSM 21853 / NBRC 104410 / AZM16c01) TaxID=511051 RepID=A0A7U6GDX0_CALEA|nr:O-antigen ligase family protein [Caldisericum exile]BAL80560.1 O-antigen polymerase family protein [Caldisericum exile AZM16c01]
MGKINSALRRIFFFLIAFYPWINYILRKVPKLGSVWDDLLILVFFLFSIFVGYKRIKDLIALPSVLFAVLFASVSILSFVFNNYLFLAFQHQFRLLLEPFLVFIAVFLVKPTKDEIHFYLKSFILSIVILGLHGIYQYIKKVPTPAQWVDKDLERTSIYTRAFSIVGSPNVLAGYLELGLPVVFYYIFDSKSYIRKILYLFGSFSIIGGLLLTFSRGGWLGAFGSLFLSFAAISPLVAIGLVVLGVFAIYSVPVLRLRIVSLIDPSYIQKSLESGGRLFRWKYGVVNGFEHPLLGSGLGTFGSSAGQKYGYFSYTSMDSVYINVFAETGFLGIVSFILFVSYGFANFVYKFFSKRKLIYLFLGASLFALLIHIFVENLFDVWGITLNFWVISALSEVLDG